MSLTTWSQDPLFVIFERHLCRSSTENHSTKDFIDAVVQDYLQYLVAQGVIIPPSMKAILVEDLTEEVREMTLKKTYGAVSLEEYKTQQSEKQKNRPPRRAA